MSRETDIRALYQLKDEIAQASSLVKMAKEEFEQGEKYRSELDTTKFVFKPLPTDKEEAVFNGFAERWKEKLSNSKKYKVFFLVIYSLLMLAVTAMMIVDFYKGSGKILQLPQSTDPEVFYIMLVAMAGFGICLTLLPWYHIRSKGYVASYLKYTLIASAVSGILFFGTMQVTDSVFIFFAYLMAAVCVIVICYIIGGVRNVMSRMKPMLSVRQKKQLDEARRSDAENAKKNIIKKEHDKAEWDAWWDSRKKELVDQFDYHMNMASASVTEAKEHMQVIDSIEVLADNEKNTEVIDWLIYFIESHRADSIKEALHEYDNMLHNQKMLEIEKKKFDLEVAKVQKENADRQRELEMMRRHQIEMQVQAQRSAESQARIAASTEAARDAAERMRRDVAQQAASAAAAQQRIAGDTAAIYRNIYYNS